MPKNKKSKINSKELIMKIVLSALVLVLLIVYMQNENENKNFTLSNTAFLYEGNKLIGVNTDKNAKDLVKEYNQEKTNIIKEETKKEDSVDQSEPLEVNTKVVNTPSLVKFDIEENKQKENMNYVKENTKVLQEGYTLTIDGKYKYYIKDESVVKWVTNKILLAFLPDKSYLDYYQRTGKFKEYNIGDKKFTSISLKNKIKMSKGYQSGSVYIENKEDLLFELFHNNQDVKSEIISSYNSIASIEKKEKMSSTEFKLNNPNLSENSVTYNGQKVVVNDLDPVVSVGQTYETTEEKDINYETVQEVDESLLVGQYKVKTEGEKGSKEVTYENQMINGKLVSTTKEDEKIIKKPVHKIILVGAKSVNNSVSVNGGNGNVASGDFTPSGNSSSGFIWPSSGTRVTCEFGCYSGHTGIDIQSYFNAPEYAAKDGVVVTSGWSNYGYGYHVVIDHGNGVQTLYAHQNSQPPVKVGQHVSQGQVIGFEGQTGNATGVHLHFEIRFNGHAVNPRGYI